jgi:flagellar motor protein MotB
LARFFANQALASQTMPKQGKRAAASKKNGALGGRSSGPAGGHPTADAPQGAAALVAPSKKEADRPRNTPSAVPLVRRDPDRICLDEAALFGHGERALLLSSMPFSLCLLFMHQASRVGKQDLVCFQCNAFCLNREQVKQELVFLNTIFLSKRNIGWWAHEGQQLEQQDHQEGKAATQQRQPQQQEGEKGSSSSSSMGACAGGTHPNFLCLR